MQSARHHRRLSSVAAVGLLALAVELGGRWLITHIDIGRHLPSPSYSGAGYYPLLLAGVKVGIALLLAHGVWRFVRAHGTAQAAGRAAAARGAGPPPRLSFRLSARLWAAIFATTSLGFLVQARAEGTSRLDPLLHSSALPVFAVLAVLAAVAWGAITRWLSEYETYAEEAAARAVRFAAAAPPWRTPAPAETIVPPRRLFGLAFESRPPPAPA